VTVVAAVDCGTNTIKLMVADLPAGTVLERESRVVRLGQGVDRSGRLAEEALARTFAAIDEYAALIGRHPVERLRFCATSATRDAANAADFAAGVRSRLGTTPDVIAGDEEARLSFDGAVRNLRHAPALPVLVVDIGGGSTELILGEAAPSAAYSMDMGSVRMHERHLHSDPPTADEVAAAVADIDAHLDACPVDPAAAATVVGVAGTITTVAAGVLDLPAYDPDRIDQAVLGRDDVHATTARILAMTVQERRALPYLHPGRVDVIGAGALILDRVLRRTRPASMVVSESDILDGIAWSLVDG
jgi:exopolyphosphatase/guanosine-5'-triphosphate,3'-diphosphate pyrophosphatase